MKRVETRENWMETSRNLVETGKKRLYPLKTDENKWN